MAYRPLGWKEARMEFHDMCVKLGYAGLDLLHYDRGFEAGADAMLKALKTKTESLTPAVCSVLNGSWVFIPDEEEKP